MRENPQEANDLADSGHESICRIMLADYKDGKRFQYLGAPYWVYHDHDMAYRQILAIESVENDIETFNHSVRTATRDNHLFEKTIKILTNNLNSNWEMSVITGGVGRK